MIPYANHENHMHVRFPPPGLGRAVADGVRFLAVGLRGWGKG